jgi:hypothetical protein
MSHDVLSLTTPDRLQSRQRKKKHTEDLETKEKGYAHQVTLLEQQLAEVNIERDNLARDRQILVHRTQEAERIIESLHMEKRDMLMKHTEETSSLRKRIQVMTDRMDASPAPAMSANPSSSGFSEFNAEFDTLNIGPHDWDNLLFSSDTNNLVPEDFAFGQQSMGPIKQTSTLGKKASTATIVPAKKPNENSNEQPIASSLLFMLLLCGAFVASKPSSSATSELPKMPPDVRAAAPTVLSNLLADTNPSGHQQQLRAAMQSFPEPVPSDVPQTNNRGASKLDQLHHHMISPSKQQSDEAAFAMTQAQYASLMDIGSTADADRMNGQIHPARRNLAEVLANAQTTDPSNKADIYTRSLLFEQIPADVVKQFKEMVRDRSQRDQQQQQQQQQQTQQNQQQRQQHHQYPQHQPYYKVEA